MKVDILLSFEIRKVIRSIKNASNTERGQILVEIHQVCYKLLLNILFVLIDFYQYIISYLLIFFYTHIIFFIISYILIFLLLLIFYILISPIINSLSHYMVMKL